MPTATLTTAAATQTGPNVVNAQRTIWNGTPGTVWVNDTDRVKYQFICALNNTCGFCLQYHLAIGAAWGIPLHYGCRCTQKAIPPAAKAPEAFVDFRELLEEMPHDQQVAAIGASNYKLLKEGIADWHDIVTPLRVRDFREVVSIKKLSVKTLTDAGVKPVLAEQAHAAVNTSEHLLVEQHRAELIEKIKAAGLNQDQLVRQIASRLAERVTVAAGPIATGKTTASWEASAVHTSHAADLAEILERWTPTRSTKPKPPPEPKEPSKQQQPVQPAEPAFHEQVTEAVERVPEVRLIGEKAWIHDVWAAHQANPLNPRLTLDEFKLLLLTDEVRTKLTLGRADLAHRMNQADMAASEVEYKIGDRITAVFNFIRPKNK